MSAGSGRLVAEGATSQGSAAVTIIKPGEVFHSHHVTVDFVTCWCDFQHKSVSASQCFFAVCMTELANGRFYSEYITMM